MNLKQIVKNVSDTIKRKRGEKTDEDYEESSLDEEEEEEALTPEQEAEMEIDSPEGNKSMLKGDHGKIFGVSKPVVIGVGVFFLVVFMLAFIYASSDSSKPNEPSSTQDMKTQIAAENSNINGKNGELADDYGELHRANEKKKAGKTQQNGQNTAETVQATHNSPAATAPASSTVSSSPQVSQVPRASVVVPSAVAPASYPTSYARNYSLPSEDSAPAEAAPAKQTAAASTSIVDKVKESLSSAIAFFGGSSGGGAAPSDSGTAGGASSVPAATSVQSADSGSSYAPAADNTITAGTLIPAMLLTGINSDVPGQVAAQIMADVYDASGTNLLIPAGSRIVGKTGSISASTGRVGVDFDTIVLPDGSSWNVGNSFTAVDGGGYSGIQGVVHNHTGANVARGIFRGAVSALSTINVDRVTLNASDLFNAKESLAPTTTVAPGYQFQIYATKNIAF